MKEVVTNARQINLFLTEISTACREQALGVEEVGRAIQELDKGSQQNSALVDETASAAAALTEQADTLQAEISKFRVAARFKEFSHSLAAQPKSWVSI